MGKSRRYLDAMNLEEVQKVLSNDLYGVTDLVEIGLCPDVNFVNNVLRNGEMKFNKVNRRNIVISKDQVLEYFINYVCPKKPMQDYTIRLNSAEMQVVKRIEAFGKNQNEAFSAIDFFRNVIQLMGSKPLKLDQRIYKTNGDNYDRSVQHPSNSQGRSTGELFDRD